MSGKYVSIRVEKDVKQMIDDLRRLYEALYGHKWTISNSLRKLIAEELALYGQVLKVINKPSYRWRIIENIRQAREEIGELLAEK